MRSRSLTIAARATIDRVMVGPLNRELTDGVVTLRRFVPADASALIAGRDAEYYRFLPDASPEPEPAAVVLNRERDIVGWIDYDVGRSWLSGDEVNIGYNTFPTHRRRGIATRALELLVSFLAEDPECRNATLLIDPANQSSIAVAERAGFRRHQEVEGELLFKRPVW